MTKIWILSAHRAFGECLARSLAGDGREVCHGVTVDEIEASLDDPQSLLLVDLRHPGGDVQSLLRRRERLGSLMKVLLLGLCPEDDPDGLSLLEWNLDGSLPLDAGLSDMADAVAQIERGEKVYPPAVAYLLFERLAEKVREQEMRRRLEAFTLTRRELEVLQLLGRRQSNDAIAGHLGISIHTVKNHVHNILGKLEVDNRVSAVDLACRRGWLRHVA